MFGTVPHCFTGEKPKQWVHWLTLTEWWYNTISYTSSKITPYEAIYGKPPPQLIRYILGFASNHSLDTMLKTRKQLLASLKHNLTMAQERMKFYVDLKCTDREFSVGDLVYLWLQPYRQTSLAARWNFKLAPQFYGPFQIIERVGIVFTNSNYLLTVSCIQCSMFLF